MKERPILFSAPMVRAILAGHKTQTRRTVKNAPDNLPFAEAFRDGTASFGVSQDSPNHENRFCPHGAVRDRLWVREAWKPTGTCLDRWTSVHYRADDSLIDRPYFKTNLATSGWRPSIFMPRLASRITLRITGLGVERLKEIREADAKSEGVDCDSADGPFAYVPGVLPHSITAIGYEESKTPNRDSYLKLWDYINGKGSANRNPWVWVISFERI